MEIVARMRGGLGNQLFQYSYALTLAQKYRAAKILLDIREYRKYKIRRFELGAFKLRDSVLITDTVKRHCKYNLSKELYYLLNGTLKRGFNRNLDFLFPLLSKYGLFYTARAISGERPCGVRKAIYLYGFFQDVRCADKIKQGLTGDLARKDGSTGEFRMRKDHIAGSPNAIAVSVRCGSDYADAGYGICTREYYRRAIREVASGLDKYQIFIFADQMEAAKEMLGDAGNIVFMEGFDPVEQLLLMKECRYFVISNSSFAWWGSYLGEDPGKIVYVPEWWYPKRRTRTTNLIYPAVKILGE